MTKEYKRYSLTYTLAAQEEVKASDLYSAMAYAEQQSKLNDLTYEIEISVEEMLTNQDQVRNRVQLAKWHLERTKEALTDIQAEYLLDLLKQLETEVESLRNYYSKT